MWASRKQRREATRELGHHVASLLARNGTGKGIEHGPNVTLRGGRIDIFALADAAHELVDIEPLRGRRRCDPWRKRWRQLSSQLAGLLAVDPLTGGLRCRVCGRRGLGGGGVIRDLLLDDGDELLAVHRVDRARGYRAATVGLGCSVPPTASSLSLRTTSARAIRHARRRCSPAGKRAGNSLAATMPAEGIAAATRSTVWPRALRSTQLRRYASMPGVNRATNSRAWRGGSIHLRAIRMRHTACAPRPRTDSQRAALSTSCATTTSPGHTPSPMSRSIGNAAEVRTRPAPPRHAPSSRAAAPAAGPPAGRPASTSAERSSAASNARISRALPGVSNRSTTKLVIGQHQR